MRHLSRWLAFSQQRLREYGKKLFVVPLGQIVGIEGGETSSETDEREVGGGSSEGLSLRDVRRVYLITYSRANLEIVPTRETFARIILDKFENAVVNWVCSQEGRVRGGVHYHMAVKQSAQRCWLPMPNYIDQVYGVKVNFSVRHENYYTAWRYTTKEDSLSVHSTNHPDLGNIGVPITTNASSAIWASWLADGDSGVQKGNRKKTVENNRRQFN